MSQNKAAVRIDRIGGQQSVRTVQQTRHPDPPREGPVADQNQRTRRKDLHVAVVRSEFADTANKTSKGIRNQNVEAHTLASRRPASACENGATGTVPRPACRGQLNTLDHSAQSNLFLVGCPSAVTGRRMRRRKRRWRLRRRLRRQSSGRRSRGRGSGGGWSRLLPNVRHQDGCAAIRARQLHSWHSVARNVHGLLALRADQPDGRQSRGGNGSRSSRGSRNRFAAVSGSRTDCGSG